MGLLDNLGAIAGQFGGVQGAAGTADPKAALVQSVLGMLVHGNQPGGLGGSGGIGGLGGLVQRFESAGLGSQVASWVGNGANATISGDQIKAALGDGPLRALAEHAGLNEDEVAAHLSSLLPQLVDQLTPNGQVPPAGSIAENTLAGAVESFSHLFTNRPA